VQIAEARNCDLHDLSESELQSAHPQLAGDVIKLLTVEGAIAARTTSNGTAPKSVVLQIAKLRSNAALTKKWVETASQKFIRTMTL
jgi:argininosuccinate lyase